MLTNTRTEAFIEYSAIPLGFVLTIFFLSFILLFTDILHDSLANGDFPSLLKAAMVKPLFKKLSLDPEILKNLWPILNLSFLSNLIERVAVNYNKHRFDHMTTTTSHNIFQSVYKPVHRTESQKLNFYG